MNMKIMIGVISLLILIKSSDEALFNFLGIFTICDYDIFYTEEFLWAQAIRYISQSNSIDMDFKIISNCNGQLLTDFMKEYLTAISENSALLYLITTRMTRQKIPRYYNMLILEDVIASTFNVDRTSALIDATVPWNTELTRSLSVMLSSIMKSSSGYTVSTVYYRNLFYQTIWEQIKEYKAFCTETEERFCQADGDNSFLLSKLNDVPSDYSLLLGNADNLAFLATNNLGKQKFLFCCLYSLTELGLIQNSSLINESTIIVIEGYKQNNFIQYLQQLGETSSTDPMIIQYKRCMLSKTASEHLSDYQLYNSSIKCANQTETLNVTAQFLELYFSEEFYSSKLTMILELTKSYIYKQFYYPSRNLLTDVPFCALPDFQEVPSDFKEDILTLCTMKAPWTLKAYLLTTRDGLHLNLKPINAYNTLNDVFINSSSSSPTCKQQCKPGEKKSLREKSNCCYTCTKCPAGTYSNISSCITCEDDKWSPEGSPACSPKPHIYLAYDNGYGITFLIFIILGLILTLSTVIIYRTHANTPIVKTDGNFIFACNMLGLVCCFFSTLGFLGEPVNWRCAAREPVFGISFALSLSSILAKTYRILSVFSALAEKPSSFQKTFHFVIIAVGTLIQVIICVLWVTIDPPRVCYFDTVQQDATETVCCSRSEFWLGGVIGYLALLALLSCLCAILSRSLPSNFNDANVIAFSMLMFFSVWMGTLPVLLSGNRFTGTVVKVIAILVSSFGCLTFLFLYKCYIILFKPEENTQEWIKKITLEYCQNLVKTSVVTSDVLTSKDTSENRDNCYENIRSEEQQN